MQLFSKFKNTIKKKSVQEDNLTNNKDIIYLDSDERKEIHGLILNSEDDSNNINTDANSNPFGDTSYSCKEISTIDKIKKVTITEGMNSNDVINDWSNLHGNMAFQI